MRSYAGRGSHHHLVHAHRHVRKARPADRRRCDAASSAPSSTFDTAPAARGHPKFPGAYDSRCRTPKPAGLLAPVHAALPHTSS